MTIEEIYHFLFETISGVGCMVAACFVLCIIACVVMERNTRRKFKNREKTADDWSLFDDDDEDADENED